MVCSHPARPLRSPATAGGSTVGNEAGYGVDAVACSTNGREVLTEFSSDLRRRGCHSLPAGPTAGYAHSNYLKVVVSTLGGPSGTGNLILNVLVSGFRWRPYYHRGLRSAQMRGSRCPEGRAKNVPGRGEEVLVVVLA